MSNTISNMLNVCKPEEAKSLLITDAFLLECMIKDNDPYLISSFIAKSIFEKDKKISAVSYPSVRQYGAINFAIRTENFWKSWSVIAARRKQVNHLACGYYESSRTEHVTGVTRFGKLVWEKGAIDNNSSRPLEQPWHPQ
ncbi:hypothetical protein [Acerihabitans arboris]|uniref:Uncharacterized protein n=1 Tax=Acerihabitans arboris TaxID=2691583 RepID=A0A845SIS4_9GAMM|nr:hypothetical protein [Acerihabitans arboris]NDL62531.1 hypothetical protein [Acerihabitans arboris]